MPPYPSHVPQNKSKGGGESEAHSSTADKTSAAPQPRRRPPQFHPNIIHTTNNLYTGTRLAEISRGTLNNFMGNYFLKGLKTIRVNGHKINGHPDGIEHIANGVIHPVTKETITKYQKLVADPLLEDV